MSLTPQDLINRALRRITVLGESQTASSAQSNDAFNDLNALLDQWQAESLMIPDVSRDTWTITSGTATYTVGSGGDVNIVRPVYIDHINFIDTSQSPNLELQLQPLTEDAWSKVPQKSLTSTYPTMWYYSATYPLGTLTFWPVPTSTTLSGAIYSGTAVAQFTGLTQSLSLPPIYQRLIITNLAVELMAEYGIQPTAVGLLLQHAADSKARAKTMNFKMMDASLDAAVLPGDATSFRYNIYAGP